MTWWKKLFKCHNPYQSFSDWFFGRWKCPVCKTWWQSFSLCDDLTLLTIHEGKIVERRLECPKCNFKVITWKRK